MDEQTTTDENTTASGAEQALPEQSVSTSAAPATTEEPGKTTDGESSDSLPAVDDKLASFAKGQGIDDVAGLSQREMSLLKSAYDNKAEYERNRQKATELEKNLTSSSDQYAEQVAEQTGQDPELLKRLQRVEVKEAVRDFWNTPGSNGEIPDRSLEPSMIELLSAKPHLAGDLDALYATAFISSGKVNALKSQGKRESLESLAHKQQAAVPTGNATTSGTSSKDKPFGELSVKEMEAKLGFAEY